jgi:uncharacterized protein YcnI
MPSCSIRLFVAIAALVAMSTAAAHVTVWPRESHQGAYEKYVVRVPTEGTSATTSIELELPADVTFIAVGAAVGHTYTLKKNNGRVASIAWLMKINPGEFAEFSFMARNPKDGTQIFWRAVQRFADGTSAEWTGTSGDKHPASVTTLTGGGDVHAH